MKTLIIGTGFLGEQLFLDLQSTGKEVITTYNTTQKYPESVSFDFFRDSLQEKLTLEEIDTVIITAKIEFTEERDSLKEKIEEFIKETQEKRIIYISSDGIFDGQKGDYTETDKPVPTTLYGKNLKICEEAVKAFSKNYCIIRPSYLYGLVNNKLDPRLFSLREELEEGKKVVRFTDMYKSPLSYKQASEYIIKIIEFGYVGTVHISGLRMSVFDFARESAQALHLNTSLITEEKIPLVEYDRHLLDTSLNYSLAEQLTGLSSLNIKQSFEAYY